LGRRKPPARVRFDLVDERVENVAGRGAVPGLETHSAVPQFRQQAILVSSRHVKTSDNPFEEWVPIRVSILSDLSDRHYIEDRGKLPNAGLIVSHH
jgi:hypothetical protein